MKTMKFCGGCETWKSVSGFSKNKRAKDGLQAKCKACEKAYYAANRKQKAEYYAKNRERIAKRRAEHYAANRERIAKQQAEYRAANRERLAEYLREWRAANPEYYREYYAANRERKAEYKRDYYAANYVPSPGYEVIKNQPTTLYRLFDETGRLLYVGITRSWQDRKAKHAADKWWWDSVDHSRTVLHVYPNRRIAKEIESKQIPSALMTIAENPAADAVQHWFGLFRDSEPADAVN